MGNTVQTFISAASSHVDLILAELFVLNSDL